MVNYGTSTLVYSDDSGVTKPQDADKAGVYTGLGAVSLGFTNRSASKG